MGKVEACHAKGTAQGSVQRPRSSDCQLGGIQMSYRHRAIAAAALSLAVLASAGSASAADLPGKAAQPAPDVPFFLVIDDRVTFSHIFTAAQPRACTVNP